MNLEPISQNIDARRSNGAHKSPSGDCEKVILNKEKTKCPDGSHRSPDGDCEAVNDSNKGDNSNDGSGSSDDSGSGSSDEISDDGENPEYGIRSRHSQNCRL